MIKATKLTYEVNDEKIEFKSLVIDILLALLVCKLFFSFSSPFSYQLFALFLAYSACVYLRAALSDSHEEIHLIMCIL